MGNMMGDHLTRKRLKAIILSLLIINILLVKFCFDMYLSYEDAVKEKDETLMKINAELSNVKHLAAMSNIEQGYNWKWIGGASSLILVAILATYFSGVDPTQMLNGLNSLGLENLNLFKENNRLITEGNKENVDTLIRCIKELSKAINDKLDQNNDTNVSWFKSILKLLGNKKSNDDFFGDNNPPSFR
jgi:hypothetical protein